MDLKWLWDQNHRINDKTVEGDNVLYYRDNTDTCASVTVDGVDYHFFDGSNTPLEWVKNFIAIRTGLYGSALGYDGTAKDLFEKMHDDMSSARKNVFVGFSRGGAIAMMMLIRYTEWCYRRKVKPRAELVSFEMPKAGGRRLYRRCKKLGFEHTRVVMQGDAVPKIVWWWCKPWTTKLITLKNSEKGLKNKHKNVGRYL